MISRVVFVAFLILCGCATPKPSIVRLYPGPPRASDEVALVSIREPAAENPEGRDSAVWIREVDGKSAYAGNVEVPPGKHVFGLIYSKSVRTRSGFVQVRDKSYARVTIDAQPNHIYLLHGRVADKQKWFAFSLDVTGMVTRSPGGTILFPKEFETHWAKYVKEADEFRERNAFR